MKKNLMIGSKALFLFVALEFLLCIIQSKVIHLALSNKKVLQMNHLKCLIQQPIIWVFFFLFLGGVLLNQSYNQTFKLLSYFFFISWF